MAGLAAARALELAGVQGASLLDTQAMGGNSQGGQIKALPARWARTTCLCPETMPARCRTGWKSWCAPACGWSLAL